VVLSIMGPHFLRRRSANTYRPLKLGIAPSKMPQERSLKQVFGSVTNFCRAWLRLGWNSSWTGRNGTSKTHRTQANISCGILEGAIPSLRGLYVFALCLRRKCGPMIDRTTQRKLLPLLPHPYLRICTRPLRIHIVQ